MTTIPTTTEIHELACDLTRAIGRLYDGHGDTWHYYALACLIRDHYGAMPAPEVTPRATMTLSWIPSKRLTTRISKWVPLSEG